MSTAQFYDGLTDTYHTLYPDWQDETTTQADALDLARLGHRLTGSDISVRAVQRARRECDAADVRATFLVADMRSLPLEDSCADVVVWADNALPHLLTDGDVLSAFAEMRRILRPGGTAIVTTRDYDRILADPPASTPNYGARHGHLPGLPSRRAHRAGLGRQAARRLLAPAPRVRVLPAADDRPPFTLGTVGPRKSLARLPCPR
jgi:SAM-dependent methyltransferase